MSRIRRRLPADAAALPSSPEFTPAPPTRRARIVFVVVVTLAVTVLGVGRLVMASGSPAVTMALATIDGMTAQVTTAGWISMDHEMDESPGYAMPDSMMPGMPTGDDQRLSVTVTVTNTSAETKPLRPIEDFKLRVGATGKEWAPKADTFGSLPRLAPNNAVSGILFFDLPPAELGDSQLWIEWTHSGDEANLTLPLGPAGEDPGHSHNP